LANLVAVRIKQIRKLCTHFIFVGLSFLSFAAVSAQEPVKPSDDLATALELLKKWDTSGAAKLLKAVTKKDQTNLVAWHWLGIANERLAKLDDARKAHEKAALLGEALLISQLGLISNENLEVLARIKPEIALATESAEAYIRLSGKFSVFGPNEWDERRELLHDYIDELISIGLTIYKSQDVTARARILDKPEPSYTEAAKQHDVEGKVVLSAILASDGTVKAIYPLKRLPYGLTAQAIRAGRSIKFIPGTKDGRPVSVWVQLEYKFNLY